MKHTIAVTWSNGQVDKAETWEALEDHVRHTQWWAMTPDEFRAAMQKRADRWSATAISTLGSSEEFFHELERASLVRIGSHDDTEEGN